MAGKEKYLFKESFLIIHEGRFNLNGDFTESRLQEQLSIMKRINDEYFNIINESGLKITKDEYYRGITLDNNTLEERKLTKPKYIIEENYNYKSFIFAQDEKTVCCDDIYC